MLMSAMVLWEVYVVVVCCYVVVIDMVLLVMSPTGMDTYRINRNTAKRVKDKDIEEKDQLEDKDHLVVKHMMELHKKRKVMTEKVVKNVVQKC